MAVTIKTTSEPRPLGAALGKGVRCKCPSCGQGKLFRAYLKVNDTCPHCNEELHHHRADDLPPYLAILIVGHVLIGAMLHMEMAWHVSPTTYLATLLPLAIILPLAMLPSLKGGVVALQWSQRMHGFDPDADDHT